MVVNAWKKKSSMEGYANALKCPSSIDSTLTVVMEMM